MVKITESLVRKRAEHNEGEIYSLEELSLHQQDIEKIEYLDKWCKDLKILYLQSNLIGRIENVGKLKKLEYLNLALNNIEVIENLENCESLKKLDLTINFVGILTSVGNLKDLYQFEELYLTGNPCHSYEGYRDFVIATLPQLKTLDGIEILKSERIMALQSYSRILSTIHEQQRQWLEKRAEEKLVANERKQKRKENQANEKLCDSKSNLEDDEFWKEETPFTPESRWETHEYLEEKRKRENGESEKPKKPERQLFAKDGRPYNINEPKIDFTFTEEADENGYKLDIGVYKYLDSSLLDCDVQPNYVRVIIKGKILQLALPEEVRPDVSTATRSKASGHLIVVMPKVKEIIRPKVKELDLDKTSPELNKNTKPEKYLEPLDWKNIVRYDNDSNQIVSTKILTCHKAQSKVVVQQNSSNFIDDPSVPPLE